jgi:D-alanyl-D-alanine carboxypeptidase (penicillin-binding protein 5/6)
VKGVRPKAWRVVLAALLALGGPVPARAAHAAAPPAIRARSAILVEAETGTVLYEKAAYRRRPPASTTKILTALVALESVPRSTVIEVSRRAAGTGGSRAHVTAGERYTLDELLKGLLLRSGNDAAVAIAEGVGGEVSVFVRRMNEEANRSGALVTHFRNPNGLPDEDHFTSAYDLALLTRRALRVPGFVDHTSTAEGTFGALGRSPRTIRNTNRLLETYKGAIGVKTGTTSAAGKCLVAAARREGLVLVAVVLASPDRWGESAALLDYGFATARLHRLLPAGRPVRDGHGRLVGTTAAPLSVVTGPGSEVEVRVRRFGSGRVRGLAVAVADGRPVGATALLAAPVREGLGRLPLARRVCEWLRAWGLWQS